MAHLVESMFSVREKPWHYEMTKDVTKLIQEAPTSLEALEYAGLNWNVYAKAVYDGDGMVIPGYVANTRDSDNSVLGIVSSRYSIVQNRDAFDFTDNLIGSDMRYETAGSLKNGKQVWLLGKMPERYIAGDKTEPYICFTNTHDGTGAVRVCMTPVRVVCNNTLNVALQGAKRSWSTRHVGDISQKPLEAKETLMLANEYMDVLASKAEELASQPLSAKELNKALPLLLDKPKEPNKKQEERYEQQKEEIMICMMRPDLANFIGTKWGFINAIADYVDHSEPMRRTKNYDQNNWGKIMIGHPMLDKAMAYVSELV